MTLFQNDCGYLPVVPNLEGHWDKAFNDLPDDLKGLTKRVFFACPWDTLDPANRRSIAAQHDYQNDPNHEPATYFALVDFAEDLKDWIKQVRTESKDAAVVVLRDVADRVEKILDIDRDRVGEEIKRLRAIQKSDYQTDLMAILHDAVKQFCSVDVAQYPKKESGEVAGWLMKRKANGTPISKQLAEAMETIIAPRPYAHQRQKKGGG